MKLRPHPFRLLAACALLVPLALAAQEAVAPAAEQHTLAEKLNSPVIYILAACSFVIIWLAGDTFSKTKRAAIIPRKDSDAIKDFFRQGDYVGAYNYCKSNAGTFANVVRTGLAFVSDGKEMTEEAMAVQIHRENSVYQNRIAYLSVIGVIAPMIGLAGTVFGMIEAFATLGQAGAADPSRLSAAIGEVLYATAGGLVVAIPAFVFYYILRNRTQTAMQELQEEVTLLFRRMPYDHLAAANISESEIYASMPNWLQGEGDRPAHPAV